MKILLAGYNVDTEFLDELNRGNDAVTPETLSAAYARISRDPRPINELRKAAIKDVERARKSNENIVFGLGHASVAEHAVLNFDIIGVSRLAVEAIQHHRLNAYTEKSQRYITLDEDYIIPEEIKRAGMEKDFKIFMTDRFSDYQILYKGILESLLQYENVDELRGSSKNGLQNLAKEDARYALPMAVTSQFGMTINARNLEYLILRLYESNLKELKTIADELYKLSRSLAPSLIKYVEPGKYRYGGREHIPLNTESPGDVPAENDYDSTILKITDSPEEMIINAFLASEGLSWNEAWKTAVKMNGEERMDFIKKRLHGIKTWDKVPREFELVDLAFEVTVSSSCFAQLKRHRMATVLPSGYNPMLGITYPESILTAGMDTFLEDAFYDAEELFHEIFKYSPEAASYVLLNAHRRRVIIKMNARELYHFSRLREDEHSQWEIRELAGELMDKARELMPAVFCLTCGKHDYEKKYKSIYGKI